MPKLKMEFILERGVVNIDEIEDDVIKMKMRKTLEYVQMKKWAAALEVLPPLSFEWSWSSGDGDSEALFEDVQDIDIALTEFNSRIRLGEIDGNLIISANVFFEVDVRGDIDRDDVQNWLNENSMDGAGYVSGGWSYHSDDGVSITAL
jgi:hypothetical protein